MLISFAAALVTSGVSAAVPALQRQIIDNVILHHRSPLIPWLAALGGAGLITFAADHFRRFAGGRVSLDVECDLRNAIYGQLQRLDFAHHDGLQVGQVVSRANSDVGLIQTMLAFVPMMIGNVLLIVASLVIMFIYSPLLAVVSLLAVPGLVVITFRMRSRTLPATWDAQQREGEVAVAADEAISGMRVIKSFGQEQRELRRFAASAGGLFRSRARAVRIQARYQALLQAIPVLGQVGVLALGGWLALRGQMSIGTFLAFSMYLLALSAPARMVAGMLLTVDQAGAGVMRVLGLLDLRPTVAERSDARDLSAVRGRIDFDNVSFGYSSGPRVLDHLTLNISPGEIIALIGAPGSGKSTATSLLPRFYDVDEGAVRVDGVDVRDVSLASLRRQIGVVFEESFLFAGSVRANIAYGRPGATDEQIEAAARAAAAHDFISGLPRGYETSVGERGHWLSGGQRQRVALARALLPEPRILILDDATSAVDATVEAEIHQALRRVMRGRTVILVAHRAATARLADRIVVIGNGRIIGDGTHDALLRRCGPYRSLAGECDGRDDRSPGTPQECAAGPGPQNHPGDVTAFPPPSRGRAAERGPIAGAAPPRVRAGIAALPPVPDLPDVDLKSETADDPSFTMGRFVRGYRRLLLAGLLLVLFDAASMSAGPLLIRSGLDSGVAKGSATALWAVSGAFLGLAILSSIGSLWELRVTGTTAERLLYALRVRICAHLHRLSADFYDREPAGRIMTRVTTDIDALSSLLQSGLINAIVALLTLAGVGAALVAWNWKLAAVTMALIVPLAAATALYQRLSGRAYRCARERVAAVNVSLRESLDGIRETQAFVSEPRNQAEFRLLTGGYIAARLRALRLVSVYFPFVLLLSDVAAALILGVGSALIAHRSLSAGELIGFLLYLDLFFAPMQQLSQTFDSYQRARTSVTRIRELMRARPLIAPPAPAPPPTGLTAPARRPATARIQGSISMRDVRFSYPGAKRGRPALRGLDLEIEPGQTVALVGPTGAGKSTVVKLLARFYDPTGGRIDVDGIGLPEIDLNGYRHQLGYVPQEAFLFSGTIRDNIAYGRPQAADADVTAAARAVGAHEFITRLGRGYLHPVNERGGSLSAGQRQLIALARAELVDPAIMLLDEATSNLDLATEAKVSHAMAAVTRDRTTILIAHRLATARRADRVIVLDQGQIVEDGPHPQLVAAGGLYASLWRAFDRSRMGAAAYHDH